MQLLTKKILLVATVLAVLVAATPEAKKPTPRIDNNQIQAKSAHPDKPAKEVGGSEEHSSQNEISDRIQVGEPIKLMLQTTARFALAQTKIPNHVSIETAMDMLNDAGFILSKPANLIKVVKVVAVSLATLLATTFFFPGAYGLMEHAWRDPVNAFNLDRQMSNGFSEKSVMGIISSKTDDALSRVGLSDSSCREKSLCYFGEIIRCTFPETSEAVTKFAADNFSNSGYKDNRYFRSFASGFVDQNCTRLNVEGRDSGNCLGNLFNSMVLARFGNELTAQQQKPKYQSIPVGRA